MSRMTLAAVLFAFSQTAQAAPPPNDECSTPDIVVGTGVFNFDLTDATTGAEGQGFTACDDASVTGLALDVWYCWTAECDGLVRINTCFQTQVDTRINFWDDCGCPVPGIDPLCCADDECDLQSDLTCEVVCGRNYLIQIGTKPGLAGGPGTFTIECVSDPCDPGPPGICEIVAGQCCAGRPNYAAADYALFAGGPIGAITASPSILGAQVLTVYDFSDFSGAIPGTNFPAVRYSDPQWTENTLGSIFGITLDPDGNIYVTPSTCYNFDVPGIGAWGDVYRIDSTTGAVSVFTTAPLPNSGQGLGNIVYDCENDQFFVTNHEDGVIYRLDSGGNVLSTFDHGVADDGAAGFCPLGERVWGVTVHGGRVFYGVWNEDIGRPSGTLSNEIWSIALSGGDFSGVATMDLAVPPNPGATHSNPVADIRFTEDGRMFVAERGMGSDTGPSPHDSRLLEFVCVNGTWEEGNPYLVGVVGGNRNSAGGVDVDYRDGERIWVTADAIQFNPDTIYGAQGLPDGGGDPSTSVLLDYQGNLDDQDKTSIGDIAITCEPDCGSIEVTEIECSLDKDGFSNVYDVTITVNNTSGVNVYYLLFPGSTVLPNIVALDPPIPSGGSGTATIQLVGLEPGIVHCVDFIMADVEVEECCSGVMCFETPDCNCLFFNLAETECDLVTGEALLTLTMTNLAAYVAEHLFIIVESPAGATVTPTYVDLPSIVPFGTFVVGPIVVAGASPGEEVCIRVTTHAEDLIECCSEVVCFAMPDCPGYNPADIDMDGVVGFNDLIALLASWGVCPDCPADLNGDGIVNFADLLILLASWG